MGLFEYVTVRHTAFVCSEGHDLRGEDFQSKDFGCVMGQVLIADDGSILYEASYEALGPPEPIENGIANVYCDCSQCPALVQAVTANLLTVTCEFELGIVGGKVATIKRVSMSTAEWLEEMKVVKYAEGAQGPMSFERAAEIRRERHEEMFRR